MPLKHTKRQDHFAPYGKHRLKKHIVRRYEVPNPDEEQKTL